MFGNVFSLEMIHLDCFKCGVPFSMHKRMYDQKLLDKTEFFCPNGHGQFFVKNKLDELKAQLEAEKKRHADTQASLEFARKQRDRADHRRAALKGVVTKIKNRVGNGVCPCCNRSFQNLQRHMAHQHPKWKEDSDG